MPIKTDLPKNNNVLGVSGTNGKSITGLAVYQQGSLIVVEINYTGGPTYVKVKGLQAEVGGTADWDSGTKVL